MKLSKYMVSSVIRLFKEERSDSQNKFYIGDFANAIRDRYKFLQSPVKIEEFNLKSGVEFIHGIFKEDQVIGKFKIYNNGIYCEAMLPTEIISEFVDDVFDWARNDFGMTIKDADAPSQIFVSNVEVECHTSLAQALGKFSSINDKITALLASYGQEVPTFEATHVTFHCDTLKIEGVRPTMFSFERRAEQPFDAEMYYSSAPLKSKDHLKILDVLEKILSS